jgi:hypothetical protein
MGRSASYVSTRLHGHAPFTEHDLGVIAEVLDVPAPWFAYSGHTLRRLQRRPQVPHKSLKVLLRMNGWRRTRNTGHFQASSNPEMRQRVWNTLAHRNWCYAVSPPSIFTISPVINDALSERSHTIAGAISSGFPTRCMGCMAAIPV